MYEAYDVGCPTPQSHKGPILPRGDGTSGMRGARAYRARSGLVWEGGIQGVWYPRARERGKSSRAFAA